MNISEEPTADLEDTSKILIDEIARIGYEWHNVLPRHKARLIEIENELYRRGK